MCSSDLQAARTARLPRRPLPQTGSLFAAAAKHRRSPATRCPWRRFPPDQGAAGRSGASALRARQVLPPSNALARPRASPAPCARRVEVRACRRAMGSRDPRVTHSLHRFAALPTPSRWWISAANGQYYGRPTRGLRDASATGGLPWCQRNRAVRCLPHSAPPLSASAWRHAGGSKPEIGRAHV